MPESYHLMVIGSDDFSPFLKLAIKQKIAHRVHFLGPRERGWKFASLCRALVLPSRYDPFGLAAAEAQAMGLPVLVSNRTGYAELVVNGQNGIIMPSNPRERELSLAFNKLLTLITTPVMTEAQIRAKVKKLDHRIILNTLIHDFLEL